MHSAQELITRWPSLDTAARHARLTNSLEISLGPLAESVRTHVEAAERAGHGTVAPRPVDLEQRFGRESTVTALGQRLSADDVIVDGGNTNFHDDVRRADVLARRQIHYVDVGTSGGIWGLDQGYCLIVGGKPEVCARLEPICASLAPPAGYLRVGDHGAGHYVKMIHNGIEYGLMQAYAEGFALMHSSAYDLDLAKVASLWLRGSVVRSWLLELTARALEPNWDLAGIETYVEDSGEGRWTIHEAIERGVPLPAITAALFTRYRSREDNPFGERLLAALRQQFGGHAVPPPAPGRTDGR